MNKIIPSLDGSHTIVSEKFGVSYHSKHGAVQETQTVFIDAGLQHHINLGKKHISILEMGFGTGLNALMTYLHCKEGPHIDYHTIEAYPISLETAKGLNYAEILKISPLEEQNFIKMHECEPGLEQAIGLYFSFTKHIEEIQQFTSNQKFDIIYYDAFAPSSQAGLWTEEMMQKMYHHTANGGTLVTYCAKGSFKRALRAAGYEVEGLPGPIGKREMTRAIRMEVG